MSIKWKIKMWWSFITRDIPRMVKNLWCMRKTISQGHPWDCSMLYLAMRDALTSMEDIHSNHGHLVNNERYARQMRIAIHCLDRLIADEYDTKNFKFDFGGVDALDIGLGAWKMLPASENIPLSKKALYALARNSKKNDLRILAKLLERNSSAWWD